VVGNLPLNPDQKAIDPATKELIDRLLLERLCLAGIARALKVSEQWLQDYVNRKYAQVARTVQVSSKKKRKLTIQCDELWSFVDHKGNKQWIWLALDAKTREIVGVYMGARDSTAASQLWKSLPPIYPQCAGAYTDFWTAYSKVLPSVAASGGRPRDG
jgi:transposase-like protein